MPTFISLRITGSASGFNSASRCDNAVSDSVASHRRSAAQNFGAVAPGHPDRANFLAGLCLLDARLHLLALEGGVAVMRGQAPGLEPRLAPHAFAQRRELTEMGGTFDGAALKAQFLRRGVVVNRRMGVVSLGVQHLLRLPPRSGEPIVALRDLDVECLHRRLHPSRRG